MSGLDLSFVDEEALEELREDVTKDRYRHLKWQSCATAA